MHLSEVFACEIDSFALYRRMKAMGLRSKRPRYVYSKNPTVHKRRADRAKAKQMPLSAVLLFEDEIILRLFPVVRRT